jgi:uncharacterized linocin/CFP29 family protein
MDIVFNGQAHGDVAAVLMNSNFDPRVLRPYIGPDGRSYMTMNGEDGKPYAQLLTNANATLTYQEWKLLDEAVIRAAKPRLRAVADIRSAGLQFTVPQGMGKTMLLTQTQSDITPATISMDGLGESEGDRPVYGLANLPLPIIHKDFRFSAREVMTSRNGNNPLDTTMAELASRRVAETAEKLLLGTGPSYAYGGGNVYGFTNFPQRLTKTLTDPTSSTWTPKQTLDDILAMRLQSQQAFHYGPWVIYNSTDWDQYLDDDFKVYAQGTLRDRIKMVDGISDIRTVDYLPSMTMVMVQMTTDVVREVVGMDITTVQWETHGGMQLHFKVMAILVPQLRADQNDNTGIVHGVVSGAGADVNTYA